MRLLHQLTDNAVTEERFLDSAFYHWKLAAMALREAAHVVEGPAVEVLPVGTSASDPRTVPPAPLTRSGRAVATTAPARDPVR